MCFNWRYSVLVVVLTGDLDIPADELSDERNRAIERGSKIVTVMPSVHSVVLQTPRGNLETINPRALVLSSVRQNIEKRDFRAAFLTCRTHRIDMNILHTYEPELFMLSVSQFIQQLQETEYIDLFLSSLRLEIFFCGTLTTEIRHPQRVASLTTKTLVPALQTPAQRNCRKSTLSARLFWQSYQYTIPRRIGNVCWPHICAKHHPILLLHYFSLQNSKVLGFLVLLIADDNSDLVRGAIEHVCFLADVNKLYDEALGLYRLDLALLIAQRSQKVGHLEILLILGSSRISPIFAWSQWNE